jgi:hypothetical protein
MALRRWYDITQRALKGHSKGTQRALKGHSKGTQLQGCAKKGFVMLQCRLGTKGAKCRPSGWPPSTKRMLSVLPLHVLSSAQNGTQKLLSAHGMQAETSNEIRHRIPVPSGREMAHTFCRLSSIGLESVRAWRMASSSSTSTPVFSRILTATRVSCHFPR